MKKLEDRRDHRVKQKGKRIKIIRRG